MNLRGVVCPLVRCCPRFAIASREPIELAANDSAGARAANTPEDKKVNRHNPIVDYLRGSETQLACCRRSDKCCNKRKGPHL